MSALSVGTVLFVAILGHLTLFPKIADLDAFYHIGHAAAYLEGSLFDSSLRWATQSVIGDRGADMWWGFHVLLMPFAAIARVEVAIRAAAFSLTLFLAGMFCWLLRRHGVSGPGWWAALFLTRRAERPLPAPHGSPARGLAGALACPALGARSRAVVASVAVVSAAITWFHLGLFWMAPGVVIAYALVRLPERMAGPPDQQPKCPGSSGQSRPSSSGQPAGWLLTAAPH